MLHPKPSQQNNYLLEHISIILKSYSSHTGKYFIPENFNNIESAKFCFNASFALLSHTNEKEPIFNYANESALKLFEMEWQELVLTPSKKSAEKIQQEDRKKLFEEVSQKGITNFTGIRVSKSGKRFFIEDGILFNLYKDKNFYGQSAFFSKWKYL